MSATKDQITEADMHDLFEAFNAHDGEKVMSYFNDDAVFDAIAGTEVYGTRFVGIEAIGNAFNGVFANFSDAQWENHTHMIVGERGVSEWTFTGTNADGKRVEAEGVDLFTFRDGKIASKRAFRKDRPFLDAE